MEGFWRIGCFEKSRRKRRDFDVFVRRDPLHFAQLGGVAQREPAGGEEADFITAQAEGDSGGDGLGEIAVDFVGYNSERFHSL